MGFPKEMLEKLTLAYNLGERYMERLRKMPHFLTYLSSLNFMAQDNWTEEIESTRERYNSFVPHYARHVSFVRQIVFFTTTNYRGVVYLRGGERKLSRGRPRRDPDSRLYKFTENIADQLIYDADSGRYECTWGKTDLSVYANLGIVYEEVPSITEPQLKKKEVYTRLESLISAWGHSKEDIVEIRFAQSPDRNRCDTFNLTNREYDIQFEGRGMFPFSEDPIEDYKKWAEFEAVSEK